jgi:hypothetical protein
VIAEWRSECGDVRAGHRHLRRRPHHRNRQGIDLGLINKEIPVE